MVITQSDVKNDLHILATSISDENRPLVSVIDALKLSMLWPISCVVGYFSSMLWLAFTFQPYTNHFNNVVNVFDEYGFAFGFGAMSLFFALIIGFVLYGPTLTYLSIKKVDRENSVIISNIKRLVLKLGKSFFLANVALAIASIFIPQALVVAPFLLMFTFIVMQIVISAEVSRYGLGTVIGKLNNLVKKI